MTDDIFGDLQDWGRVLDQLEKLKRSKSLDAHQEGLRRVLRYPDNWRLRESALEAVKGLKAPSDEIIQQVVEIMMREDLYWQVRVLAAETLRQLVKKRGAGDAVATKAVRDMKSVADLPELPILRDSIRRFLRALEETN